jgi:glycosyltransferase involved in cell wall biosynthesis
MRVYFVHGRPAGHPMHAKYGNSIDAKFQFEDPWFRWHDKSYPAGIRYLAWVVNSLAFIKIKNTIIVTEGLRLTVVLGKLLSFGRITLIALVDDESPYFIHSGFYSKLSTRVNTWAYRQYNACICIGKMETDLIKNISHKKTLIATGFNGIAKQLYENLALQEYGVKSKRIVFIGNGPAQWRAWYKGLDLMLSVFSDLIDKGHNLTFDIAGNWDIETLCKSLSADKRERIKFVGKIDDVSEFLKGASLYLHTARGEAWGISINEAMAAGVVPIVSEWTGAKEMVERVSTNLIVELRKETIVERVSWFFSLSDSIKLELSGRCKEVSAEYIDEGAVDKFKENFQSVTNELALNR